MTDIPKSHPRYISLVTRERLVEMMHRGIVSEAGLIAHGRGEAFDYLLGERTGDFAYDAERAAVAMLITAEHPVISVNGNAAALAGKELLELAELVGAVVEVNLFHRTEERVRLIVEYLQSLGGKGVLGPEPDASIPGLEHARALCHKEGIYSADVVLVPLEDGDRAEAIKKMGKIVVTIDLNPMSRTAKAADVTIVNNIIRAVPEMVDLARRMNDTTSDGLRGIIERYDNSAVLRSSLNEMLSRLED